jgi:predicted RNA-binding protein with PIN domain
MVYTKEAQTADQYIEKFAHTNRNKYNITVATSDGLQQIIIRGAGSTLLSARELKEEIIRANERMKQEYQEKQKQSRNYLMDTLSPEEKSKLENMMEDMDKEVKSNDEDSKKPL